MSHPQAVPVPVDPKKNPSYPAREHLLEKPHWQSVLQGVEGKLALYRQKLGVLPSDARRPAFERILAQMMGARDQVADAVRRLPQETGHLYEEDHHRVDEAVAALDRLFKNWDALTASH